MSTLNIAHNKQQTKSVVAVRLTAILVILVTTFVLLLPNSASVAGADPSDNEAVQPNPLGNKKVRFSDLDGNVFYSSDGEGTGEVDIKALERGLVVEIWFPPTYSRGELFRGNSLNRALSQLYLPHANVKGIPADTIAIKDVNGVPHFGQPDYYRESEIRTENVFQQNRYILKWTTWPETKRDSLPDDYIDYPIYVKETHYNIHGLQVGRDYSVDIIQGASGMSNYLPEMYSISVTSGDGTGTDASGNGETDGEPGDPGAGDGTVGEDTGDDSGSEPSDGAAIAPGENTQTGSNTDGEAPASGNVDKTTAANANGSISPEATNGSMESLPSASAQQLSQATANDDNSNSGIAGQTQAIPLAGGGRLYTIKGGIVESLPEFAEQLITSTPDIELTGIAWLRIIFMATLGVSLPVGLITRRYRFTHAVRKLI